MHGKTFQNIDGFTPESSAAIHKLGGRWRNAQRMTVRS